MAKEKPEHGPSEQEVFEKVLHAAQTFLAANALHILLVVAVIVLVVVAYKTYALKRQTVALQQWEAIGSFPELTAMLYGPQQSRQLREQSILQCRAILREGAETQATPWVALKLGNLYAAGGEWREAAEAYRRVVDEYPQSGAAPAAREALAVALEETGQYSRAAQTYGQLARDGAPRHLLAAGRASELAGKAEAARGHYAEVLARTEQDEYRALAQARLDAIAAGQLLQPPPTVQPFQVPPATPSVQVSAETPSAEVAAPQPAQEAAADR